MLLWYVRQFPLPNDLRIFYVIMPFPSHGSQKRFPDKTDLERKLHKYFICEKLFKSISINSILIQLMLTLRTQEEMGKEEIMLSLKNEIKNLPQTNNNNHHREQQRTIKQMTWLHILLQTCPYFIASLYSEMPRKSCQYLLSPITFFLSFKFILGVPSRRCWGISGVSTAPGRRFNLLPSSVC